MTVESPLDRIRRLKLNKALKDIEDAAKKAKAVADSLLDESFDDAELKTEIEQKLLNLETEYAPKLTEVAQQLAQTDQEIFLNTAVSREMPRPCITLLDDDTRAKVYTILKQIAIDYNVPFSCATITGNIGTNDYLTLGQMKELQDVYDFEFLSHTDKHIEPHNSTEEVLDQEFRTSYEWLRDNGFGGRTAIVYPYGGVNDLVEKVARRYYKCGIRVDDGIGTAIYPPLDTYRMRRVFDTYGLEKAKSEIDNAKANNGWVIYGLHVNYPEYDDALIRSVVEYALSQGLEFVSVEKGLEIFGNVVDVKGSSEGQYFRIGRNGNFAHNRFYDLNITKDSPIEVYPLGDSEMALTSSQANAFDSSLLDSGVLRTYRASYTNYSQKDIFSYQTFETKSSFTVYKRYWIPSSRSWSSFTIDDARGHVFKGDNNAYTPTTPIGSYRTNALTTWRFDAQNNAGMPSSAGLVDVYKIAHGYSRQIVYGHLTNNQYGRYVKMDGTYSDFEQLHPNTFATVVNPLSNTTWKKIAQKAVINYIEIERIVVNNSIELIFNKTLYASDEISNDNNNPTTLATIGSSVTLQAYQDGNGFVYIKASGGGYNYKTYCKVTIV